MRHCTVILAAAIIVSFYLECHAQEMFNSNLPAARGITGEFTTLAANLTLATPTRTTVLPSRGRVINTQLLTITGSPSVSQPFVPLTISTATLTITGSTLGAAFSPITINTQPLTITGSSGGN